MELTKQNLIDNKDKIASIYFGRKAGCMCGCKGTHTKCDESRFNINFNRAIKFVQENDLWSKDICNEYSYAESTQTGKVLCIYFKK